MSDKCTLWLSAVANSMWKKSQEKWCWIKLSIPYLYSLAIYSLLYGNASHFLPEVKDKVNVKSLLAVIMPYTV